MKWTLWFSAILLCGMLGKGMAAECQIDMARSKTEEAENAAGDLELFYDLARQAVELCDGYARAHNALGMALEKLQHLEESAAEYAKACDLDANWYLPWLGRGDVELKRGHVDQARGYYEEALRRASGDSERNEAQQALEGIDSDATGHVYVDSRELRKILGIGTKAIRPKTPGLLEEEMGGGSGGGYSVSELGYSVDLTILFKVNSADLLPQATKQIDALGRAMQASREGEDYAVQGHASTDGPSSWNQRLSEARAATVVRYLTKHFGVPSNRLRPVGMGTKKPVLEGGVENRIKSRRVTVVHLWEP